MIKKAHLASLVCGIAVILAAEPVCRRIVIPARHHSAATVARWMKWNQTHTPPTPKAILTEIDLICPPVLTEDADVSEFLLSEDAPVWIEPAVEPTVPIAATALPDDGFSYSGSAWLGAPVYLSAIVPITSTAAAPVPEPLPIYLLLAGALGLGLLVRGVGHA